MAVGTGGAADEDEAEVETEESVSVSVLATETTLVTSLVVGAAELARRSAWAIHWL